MAIKIFQLTYDEIFITLDGEISFYDEHWMDFDNGEKTLWILKWFFCRAENFRIGKWKIKFWF